MTELSERLAGLSGADRATDRQVAVLLGWQTDYAESLASVGMKTGRRWRNEARNVSWTQECDDYPPYYTSDLSVVVAEVERRGWWWRVGRDCSDNSPFRYWGSRTGCFGATVGKNYGDRGIAISAVTPCLALLRALVSAVEAEHAHVPT